VSAPPHGLLPARAFPLAVEHAAVNELCDGAYKPRVQSLQLRVSPASL
jgi:hypothetical protein